MAIAGTFSYSNGHGPQRFIKDIGNDVTFNMESFSEHMASISFTKTSDGTRIPVPADISIMTDKGDIVAKDTLDICGDHEVCIVSCDSNYTVRDVVSGNMLLMLTGQKSHQINFGLNTERYF